MIDRLNDLTREQIAEIRNGQAITERACLWCEKEGKMRVDQKFCSAKCRSAYANAAARKSHEALLQAQKTWHKERDEMVKEIARLRAELAARK